MAIEFPFDGEKLVQVIAFFASKGLPGLTRMKLSKLIYYADKRHLHAFGRPITGDTYVCMDHGPVPSHALDLLRRAAGESSSADWKRFGDLLGEFVHAQLHGPGQGTFEARRPPDFEVLSDSDVQVLEAVAKNLGGLSANELRDLTHLEPDYLEAERRRGTKKSVSMSYELLLEGLPGNQKQALHAVMAVEDEDRKFAALPS